jgi:cyclin-dependent kinase 8/11
MPGNGYTAKVHVLEKYNIVGFISSGTYGRVYKAEAKDQKLYAQNTDGTYLQRELFAIKKSVRYPIPLYLLILYFRFKPEKEGDQIQYTGLSQSAIREMSLCTELDHPNLIHLVEIILQEKCVYMVFEYCEHDLLQIIHHHTQPTRHAIPATMVKSILFQLLNGLLYLHQNWVLHRDLKPANIMVTSAGAVRIGDLGLARRFDNPLASLFSGDKVVVTIWYRSPELLLGSRHYTPAVDMWAVGCIFAELLSLRPIFKGEETKMDPKKSVPFQRNQMGKIVEVLDMPRKEDWPGIVDMPEYQQLQNINVLRSNSYLPQIGSSGGRSANGLEAWYNACLRNSGYPTDNSPGSLGYDLLSKLLNYDPTRRLTAEQALGHDYFRAENGKIEVSGNCFDGLDEQYPPRRVSTDTNDIATSSLPGTKRSVLPDDSQLPVAKRKP